MAICHIVSFIELKFSTNDGALVVVAGMVVIVLEVAGSELVDELVGTVLVVATEVDGELVVAGMLVAVLEVAVPVLVVVVPAAGTV